MIYTWYNTPEHSITPPCPNRSLRTSLGARPQVSFHDFYHLMTRGKPAAAAANDFSTRVLANGRGLSTGSNSSYHVSQDTNRGGHI